MKLKRPILAVVVAALVAGGAGVADAAGRGGAIAHSTPHAPAFRGSPRAAAPSFHGAPRAAGPRWDGHRGAWHGRGHGHGGVFVGVAPFWWDPWPPVYVAPPPVVVQEPPVYVEQAPGSAPPSAYWYYCPSANAYYPNVPTCPEPWVPVPPSGG
ncbi:MAG TPA: hypothetical protein VFL90_17615 [Methylomirabilota bacterium]|nr:hypothetical protein [Methylomirabilota bacterium]